MWLETKSDKPKESEDNLQAKSKKRIKQEKAPIRAGILKPSSRQT